MTSRMLSRLPTWVYRMTCMDDCLLYVGVAVDIDRRIAQHAATKDWWLQVAFIDVERYPTRLAALTVEAFYIAYEQPKYNLAGMREIPDAPYQDKVIGRRSYISPKGHVDLIGVQGDYA